MVRATAVQVMERMGMRDPGGSIERFLHDPDEGVRRAAVGYLLTMSRQPTTFVRTLLEGDDPVLRHLALDALFERPHEAPAAVPPAWIEARLQSGAKEDLLLAARALGIVRSFPAAMLRTLIQNPDPDVRRAALLSATRRPSRDLVDLILPLMDTPEFSNEARHALAALGDHAVPALTAILNGEGSMRARTLAARTLAQIASPRAIDALLPLARGGDRALRQLSLRNLSRIRVRTGHPVIPRALAHRFFLRDLREYRAWLVPAIRLAGNPAPELRLLADSFREFADMALERAVRALACWYDPRALFGAFEHLRSRTLGDAAPALEYLSHYLPRSVYKPVSRLFEEERLEDDPEQRIRPHELADWIRAACESGDAWLKACAMHASRHVPELTPA
jgi:HEAT repeat protein